MAGTLHRGDKIVCAEHDGAHDGVIAADLGFGYAVVWPGLNTDRAIGRAHGKDSVQIAYDGVRSA